MADMTFFVYFRSFQTTFVLWSKNKEKNSFQCLGKNLYKNLLAETFLYHKKCKLTSIGF